VVQDRCFAGAGAASNADDDRKVHGHREPCTVASIQARSGTNSVFQGPVLRAWDEGARLWGAPPSLLLLDHDDRPSFRFFIVGGGLLVERQFV
jgi:hypothetical protein